ncbi:hypothetical protein BH11ACT3_BH11ACT3_11880 [soil metagenome]
MHSPDGSTWRAREDASREVLVALYLRDAIGIVDPSGLPRLLGTGLPASPPPVDDLVAWAWTRWWVGIIEPDQRMAELPDDAGPRWEPVLRRHLDDARTFAGVAHDDYSIRMMERLMADGGDVVMTELVAERERELGRASTPFDLRIEVLPLTAAGIWWIAESAIAVDERLREDLASYREALRPIVERLV